MEITKEVSKKNEFKNGLFLIIKALIIFVILLLTVQKNYFVFYKTQAILGLIIITSFFIFILRKNDFTAPIIALLLIGFLEMVDSHLWRYPPFSSMFTVEDFSGTYEGRKVSEYVKKIEEYSSSFKSKEYRNSSSFTLKIHQTGSQVSIYSFCSKSEKEKIHESMSDKIIIFSNENTSDYELIYHFKDIGVPKDGRYSGTANLHIKREDDEFHLEGGFYTNRNPQTRGRFVGLKRMHKKLLNPLYRRLSK